MSKAVERALALFEGTAKDLPRLNCGQSVLVALAPAVHIDTRTAIRVARGFGGGIGHQGDVCGALCAAVMALGLTRNGSNEPSNRSAAYADTRELFRRFRERYGYTECRLLIGVDPSTPEGEQEVHSRGIHHTHCTRYVRSAVEIVEDVLREVATRPDRRSP